MNGHVASHSAITLFVINASHSARFRSTAEAAAAAVECWTNNKKKMQQPIHPPTTLQPAFPRSRRPNGFFFFFPSRRSVGGSAGWALFSSRDSRDLSFSLRCDGSSFSLSFNPFKNGQKRL